MKGFLRYQIEGIQNEGVSCNDLKKNGIIQVALETFLHG